MKEHPNWVKISDHPLRTLKSDSHLPKKFALFALLKALLK